MEEELELARNKHNLPTSLLLGNEFKATCSSIKPLIKLSIPVLAGEYSFPRASINPSVLIKTGQIALTLIPLFPNSFAKACVIPFTPNFVAQ
jgi:hypothetical protein